MFQRLSVAPLVPLMLFFLGGCGPSHSDAGGAKTGRQTALEKASHQPASANNSGKKMTNEQEPINQRFASLDEYLAHLQRTQGPVDGPWYRQIRPGIYELQTGNLHLAVPGEEKQSFTREELAEKFGFSK